MITNIDYPLLDLANRAYNQARAGDATAVADTLDELMALPDCCLSDAMSLWIDRTASQLGVTAGGLIPFELEADGTAQVAPIDQVRPTVAWAGRMFGARLHRDRDMWETLLTALTPGDEHTRLAHVRELLMVMAHTSLAAAEDPRPLTCCPYHAHLDAIRADDMLAVAHLN